MWLDELIPDGKQEMMQSGLESRTECIRCGQCCLNSSPTLQKEDARLVLEGRIPWEALYTVRVGELVHDPVEGRSGIAAKEMIKLKERVEGGGCVFYDAEERACRIYPSRPSQCSALACWDLSAFMRVYEGPKAQRTDVIEDPNLLRLMAEHEERCNYEEVAHWVWAIEEQGEKAVGELLNLLRFDHDLRPLASRRLNLDAAWMDLLFGRPLVETIVMFGLEVKREADGAFLLTALPRDRRAEDGPGARKPPARI